MRAFFLTHSEIVYFAYGLAFFLMGWSIWFQQTKATTLRLGRHLRWLALFGLLHGTSEWFEAFLPGLRGTVSPALLHNLTILHAVVMAVSFLCLYLFGANLVAGTDPRWRWLPPLGAATLGLWLATFVAWGALTGDAAEWFIRSEIWARYLLAFPGAGLSALGLRLQVQEFLELDFSSLVADLRMSGVTLALYSVVGGLLVPTGDFFPANVLNREVLLAVGLPSPLLRGLCAALVALYMVRLLRVFETENRRRLEQAESARVAAEERERLGRDLHDGILQSIFATGLGLQMARERLAGDPEDAGCRIDLTLERLERVMAEIRAFITGLDQAQGRRRDLLGQLTLVVAEFRQCSGVPASLNCRGLPDGYVPDRLVPEVTAMVSEALSNVSRHARAQHAEVLLELDRHHLTLRVQDDGKGFRPEEVWRRTNGREHRGLQNLFRRAERLGGEVSLDSAPGSGTTLHVTLPLGKGEEAHVS